MKRNAWFIAFIAFLSGIVVAACNFKVPPTMVLIMNELQVSMAEVGLLSSVYFVAGIILSLPAGGIMIKTGPKKLVVFSLVCTIVGSIIGAIVPNFTILLISRLIEGIGFGFVSVAAPAIIALSFSPEKRGLPMALWSIWIAVGMLFMFTVTNSIVPAFGWRGDWWLVAVLGIVVLILVVLFVQDPKPESGGQEQGQGKPSFSEGFKSVHSWLLAAIFFCFSVGASALPTFGPTFFVQNLGMDLAAANGYASLYTVGMAIGGILVGVVLTKVRNLPGFLLLSLILSGFFFYFSFNLTNVNTIIPFMIAAGVVYSIAPATIFTVAPNAAASPGTIGITLGLASIGVNLSTFITPIILGSIVEANQGAWNSVTPYLMGAIILGIIAAVLFIAMMSKKTAVQTQLGKGL